MLVYLTVVGPVTWHIWIDKGTGNANFFYAATLVFFIAQGWIIRDCMTSSLAIFKYNRLYNRYTTSSTPTKKDN